MSPSKVIKKTRKSGVRRIVVIKGGTGECPCEIYFVLKSRKEKPENEKNVTRDIVCEANRIIDEGLMTRRQRWLTPPLFALIFFTLGVLFTVILLISF